MSSDTPKKNRTIGRNSLALIQLLLFGLTVIMIAFSLKGFAPKLDLTEQKSFTLSDYTQKLLTSELLDQKHLTITCLADHHTPYFDRVHTMLEEYERLSKGRIKLHSIDPLNHPAEAFRFTERFSLRPTDDLIVIHEENHKPDQPNKAASVIDFADLMLYEVDSKKQRKLSAYQIEDQVTTTLLAQLEERRRKVYLVSNNADSQNLTAGSIGSTLQALYRNQNIDISPLSLTEVDRVPADASGLLFLTPQYDLEPAEMEKLLAYWNTPKASILCILDPQKRPKRLRAFLRAHGITLRNDRVYNLNDETLSTKTVATFTPGTELNQALAGQSSLFDGVSATLEVREMADDLINKRIAPLALIQTSESHYSEARYSESPASYNEDEDLRAPLYLAAAVIKGNEMSDQTSALSSRMVVLSNSEFLMPETIRNEQVDFVKNTINWLVGRPELVGIGPKPLQRYKLNLVPAEVAYINRLSLIFLPLGFLIIAAFVWNIRRP